MYVLITVFDPVICKIWWSIGSSGAMAPAPLRVTVLE